MPLLFKHWKVNGIREMKCHIKKINGCIKNLKMNIYKMQNLKIIKHTFCPNMYP